MAGRYSDTGHELEQPWPFLRTQAVTGGAAEASERASAGSDGWWGQLDDGGACFAHKMCECGRGWAMGRDSFDDEPSCARRWWSGDDGCTTGLPELLTS